MKHIKLYEHWNDDEDLSDTFGQFSDEDEDEDELPYFFYLKNPKIFVKFDSKFKIMVPPYGDGEIKDIPDIPELTNKIVRRDASVNDIEKWLNDTFGETIRVESDDAYDEDFNPNKYK